jgi:hypothetical protein
MARIFEILPTPASSYGVCGLSEPRLAGRPKAVSMIGSLDWSELLLRKKRFANGNRSSPTSWAEFAVTATVQTNVVTVHA